MTQPALVTIILTAEVPTWFEKALSSVLAQDYPYCEIIIADSSGARFIPELLQPWLIQPAHPVRHVVFDKNCKTVHQEAVSLARGKYIKFITDAELLRADCVSQMVSGLKQAAQCRVVACKRNRIDPQGDLLPDMLSTSPLTDEPSILNGRDFLRTQSRLSYSLAGELTAGLFYRDDLLALFTEGSPLFYCNGELLTSVEGVLIYSKLLSTTDLLWLPQALCSIRASDVYRQPHQLEGEEQVKKAFDGVLDAIRAQPWFEEMSISPECVRTAPLSDPLSVTPKNPVGYQHYHLNLNALEWWNRERSLLPFQQRLLQKMAENQDAVTRVGVVILTTERNSHGLSSTLDSLALCGSNTLQLNPIVVGFTEEVPAGISAYAAEDNLQIEKINQLINQHEDAWFIFIDAGDCFQSSGLIALSTTLPQADNVLALYADEFFYLGDSPTGVAFRPDFSLDLLLSSPKTMAQHWLFRRELLLAAEGFDSHFRQSAELDLIVKMIESQGLNVTGHLAEPLLTVHLKKRDIVEDAAIIERHLNNRGYPKAQIALDNYYNYRLRYQHDYQPKVSVIILANWHLPSLISCVTTLLEKTSYLNYELLIVADSQGGNERDSWLTSIANVDPQRIRVINYDKPYHHGPMANLAADQARGDYLMFMHCELAVTDGEWLDNLLNHGQRPEVAIVGGKQLSSDNRVRHAGYILGKNGVAGEVFRGLEDDQPSYQGRLHLDQNYSAVSGDFMLVRKEVFSSLGGFDVDQHLYGDVDFCLRARNEGYLTVWTPYARILRPAARQNPFPGETVHSSTQLKQREEEKLFQRWMPLIAHDPAYNANLSLRSRHFDVSSDSVIGWRPVQRENIPTFLVHHADNAGCGHYRMIKPLTAMQEEGLAQGKTSMTLLSLSEAGQFNADSLIIQRRYSPAFHKWIERMGKVHSTFKVFELDDYILNVPMKHYKKNIFKQEIAGQLRKSLTFFDRFVVSTASLAEAMSALHPEIIVVKNRLPLSWWSNLNSKRNQGRKPRVGWAGGASHRGDLEMIADVVKEFANDVEWVFMGMCPAKIKPYVHEVHYGVDISLYPETLAALNLDLAIAPVEDNIFNACKSNLRLLEYGACGIPVICSNVACYTDDDLPVTRVNNRFIDWRDAVRMHLADPDASARMGLELQAAVQRDWMLTGDNVKQWVSAWSAN